MSEVVRIDVLAGEVHMDLIVTVAENLNGAEAIFRVVHALRVFLEAPEPVLDDVRRLADVSEARGPLVVHIPKDGRNGAMEKAFVVAISIHDVLVLLLGLVVGGVGAGTLPVTRCPFVILLRLVAGGPREVGALLLGNGEGLLDVLESLAKSVHALLSVVSERTVDRGVELLDFFTPDTCWHRRWSLGMWRSCEGKAEQRSPSHESSSDGLVLSDERRRAWLHVVAVGQRLLHVHRLPSADICRFVGHEHWHGLTKQRLAQRAGESKSSA